MNIYDNDYTEVDSSPMATQQQKFLKEYFSPARFFERHCAANPDAPECRVFED